MAPETQRILEGAVSLAMRAGRPVERLRYSDVLVSLCDSPATAPFIERLGLSKAKIAYFISHKAVLPDAVEWALPEVDRRKPVWVRIDNDDFTPMDVVTKILASVFKLTEGDAQALMMKVHTEGEAFLGPFGHGEALDLAQRAVAIAQEGQHPLRVTLARSRRQFLLARHWRGDLPLGQSFWRVLVKGTVSFGALGAILLAGVFTRFPPLLARIAIYAFTGIAVAFVIWQLTGVWRAATRCTRRWWGIPAGTITQALVGLTLIGLVAVWPAVTLRWQTMASSIVDIASLPPLEIEASGSEALYVRGGIGRGAARRFERALDEHPTVRLVILEGPGGLRAGAIRMQRLIRERGLNTLVEANCHSACALAFLGGVERYILVEGRLGFHQPMSAFGFAAPRALHPERDLLESGVAPWFAERAMGTSPTSIWIPSEEELIEAGVVHEVWD